MTPSRDVCAAALGTLAMQVPYGLAGEPDAAGLFGRTLTAAVPVDLDSDWTGYDDHWWWDNLAHLLGGYAVGGTVRELSDDSQRTLLGTLTVACAWELFEYVTGERPWHTDESGQRAWDWDRAAEDTVLDLVFTLLGAYIAARR